MKKNLGGQSIGAEVVSATTGAAFTGAVTVYVTGDAGTQAVGSVSAGACTHEGNGYHTYAPAQAETNYDLVAFTFIGTGAVPATVQVYTSFPQTGDNFVRLGAPAGASVSADVAAIQADTDNLQTRIPTTLVSGRIDASVGAIAANAITAAAIATDAIDADAVAADAVTEIQAGLATSAAIAAVQADTDNIQTRLPTSLVSGRMDVSVGAMAADVLTASALATDAVLEIVDALLNRDFTAVADTNARTLLNAARFLRNKWSITGTTLTVTKENDATAAWTSALVGTPGADPVTSSDPV